MLVVPRRHVASLLDLDGTEVSGVRELVSEIRGLLQDRFYPDGFNIGVSDGAVAAGLR